MGYPSLDFYIIYLYIIYENFSAREPGSGPVVGDVSEHAQQPEFDSHWGRIPGFLTKEQFSYKNMLPRASPGGLIFF